MKRTSPSLSAVSSAARSPGFSRTGPVVVLIAAPISCAMMCASVVLPRPGGPEKRIWSTGSPRRFAASSAIPSDSRVSGWPMNVASDAGRIAVSSRSSAMSAGVTSRSTISPS